MKSEHYPDDDAIIDQLTNDLNGAKQMHQECLQQLTSMKNDIKDLITRSKATTDSMELKAVADGLKEQSEKMKEIMSKADEI